MHQNKGLATRSHFSYLKRPFSLSTYPGSVIGGTISKVKFYYEVGETVSFKCSFGLDINGVKMLECLADGSWSASVPTCSSKGE